MTPAPRGLDILITDAARTHIDALNRFNHDRLGRAFDQLLRDPTTANPIISVNTDGPAGDPQLVLRLPNPVAPTLAIYFDMLNAYVVAVRRIRLEA